GHLAGTTTGRWQRWRPGLRLRGSGVSRFCRTWHSLCLFPHWIIAAVGLSCAQVFADFQQHLHELFFFGGADAFEGLSTDSPTQAAELLQDGGCVRVEIDASGAPVVR